MSQVIDLDSIELQEGSHGSPEEGMCMMEVVSYLKNERFSAFPTCVSRVLGGFLRTWNDSLDTKKRQKLKPYIVKVIGTAGDGHDELRLWMCADWMMRECAPALLNLTPSLALYADSLRTLPEIRDKQSMEAGRGIYDAVWSAPEAVGKGGLGWDAGWYDAWHAARETSWTAPWGRSALGWNAGWNEAWDEARDASWTAPGSAAGSADKSKARDAVFAASSTGIWDVANAAASDAVWERSGCASNWGSTWTEDLEIDEYADRARARVVAERALNPVVESLQISAFKLLDRMIDLPKVSK